MSELVMNLTGETFRAAVSSTRVLLVDFWAPWCAPCRMMAPTLEKLAEEADGRLVVAKLNVDEDGSGISEEMGIRGIPAFILFRDGQEVARTTGSRSLEAMRDWVNSVIAPGIPGDTCADPGT